MKEVKLIGRKRRSWHPHLFYHIVCRRNHRDALFLDSADFKTFLYILNQLYERYSFELPCYSLMTNHYHLMLRSQEHSISKIMSLLNKRYANYYNTRYRLNGHLFEKRFFSDEVYGKEGILEVSRYIHRNPLEAGMVKKLEDYQWSSYPFFFNSNSVKPSYMTNQIIMQYFEGTEEEKMWRYHKFCLEEKN